MNELAECNIDKKDIINHYDAEEKDIIIEGMKEHDDKFGQTTNHPAPNTNNNNVLTQQQAIFHSNEQQRLHGVANLQMNIDDLSNGGSVNDNDINSDGSSVDIDDSENYASFTDATDKEAVTVVQNDNFSDNESEDIDLPTETQDLNLSEIKTSFNECNETDNLDPVLTNPLRGKNGKIRPTGQLRDGVAESFHTIFDCVKFCGGMDISFFRRITANSNENAEKKVVRGNFVGYKAGCYDFRRRRIPRLRVRRRYKGR